MRNDLVTMAMAELSANKFVDLLLDEEIHVRVDDVIIESVNPLTLRVIANGFVCRYWEFKDGIYNLTMTEI